ncbi:hypothetical protein MRX96_049416 [Rhipicephalus microplus]
MDPNHFYSRVIPSDSEDSNLSGRADDPEYVQPDVRKLKYSTSESSACSKDDDCTANGIAPDHCSSTN